MAKYTIEDTTLTNIADAIRAKGNTTETLTPTQMPNAISAIQAGGGEGVDFSADATTHYYIRNTGSSSYNSQCLFLTWKDYITDFDDVLYLMIASGNVARTYVKGWGEITTDSTGIHMPTSNSQCNSSSSLKITEMSHGDGLLFIDSGVRLKNSSSGGYTTPTVHAVYIILKKKEVA